MWVMPRTAAFPRRISTDCTACPFYFAAIQPIPICSPARTSLITGRYPRQIGTLTMAGDLFPQIPTFMQALQGAGYKTYGIGKFHYNQTYPWSTPRAAAWIRWQENRTRSLTVMISSGRPQASSRWFPTYCFYGDYLAKKGHTRAGTRHFSQSGGQKRRCSEPQL